MKIAITALVCLLSFVATGQTPTPFTCSGTDGFGYYVSSATSTNPSGTNLTYASSRLSKLTTTTGVRVTLCEAAAVGVSLNGLAFNPRDKFLYAVSRYDATQFSGKLYRLGENCAKAEIPVTGAIVKFANNNPTTIDAAGGNISSGTFDLDGNYYVNTSFTNAGSTGFRNKIQKIRIVGNTATVISTKTLTCSSCTTTSRLQITDIIFDEKSRKLYGSNKETNTLYSIDAATGVITPVGTTGITNTILGIYKNRLGEVRAIDNTGRIYSVAVITGKFTQITDQAVLNSSNADAASGCYAPPSITGTLFNDANGLTDNGVNGTATNQAGTTPLFVNLVQNNLVIKTSPILTNGTFKFLGDFDGSYTAQVSVTEGTAGSAPPAQALPATYVFVGDHQGTANGNDGIPDGRYTFSITLGNNLANIKFGINAKPVANDVTAAEQVNPGDNVRVIVPPLSVTDAEDGVPKAITIVTLPDGKQEGILYYNNQGVTAGQFIPNFDPTLFEFDPVNGPITATFTYRVEDRAKVSSNVATITIPFTNVMPITLVYFRGQHSGKAIELSWQTSTQYNTDYFIVERSLDGEVFTEVGRLTAEGFSESINDYTLVDHSPQALAYYRLKDVDFDGSFSHSPTITVQVEQSNPVEIYPTLVDSRLTIDFDHADKQHLNIAFYNSSGSLQLSKALAKGERTIELAKLPAGFYSVVITDRQNGKVTTRKIIKR